MPASGRPGTTERVFGDRREAGRVLAGHLSRYRSDATAVVLGLPRGGVPVAYEVANAIGAPLDVFVVRKLGVPGQEELAMGAIASGGVIVLNDDIVQSLRIPADVIRRVAQLEERELTRQEHRYRAERPTLELRGRTSILVDDGLATGATMLAAIQALRQLAPARIVVAVPVAPPSTCRELQGVADEVICATTREPFRAVGLAYRDFAQTSDEEVSELLSSATASARNSDRIDLG